MILGIQGTRNFTDYPIFLRAMGTALTKLPEGDKEILLYTAGPSNVNSMALEFSNISERSLKARGIRIKTIKVSPRWMKDNITSLTYFAFFSKPKESLSDLVDLADAKDVEVGVYRY
jgi:hypothetical protein